VGGFVANSLTLLADAGHMLTDVAALGLTLFVTWFSRRPETPKRTYGYLRLEIFAAFLNGGALLVISALIIWEAVTRIRQPEPVAGGLMLVIALVGLVANVIAARTLHPASESSLNLRGAYLHILGDLLGSVGTVVAAVVIRTTGWHVADPIASIIVSLLILRSAWALVRESVDVMLESTPSHISLGAVRATRGDPRHRGRARLARLDGDLRRHRDEHARHRPRAGAAPARARTRPGRDAVVRHPARDGPDRAAGDVRARAASARVAGSSTVTPARGDASLIVLSLLSQALAPP